MAIRKVVNGQVVLMSPEEEETFIASRGFVSSGARQVSKSLVVQRLVDAGLIDAAYAVLTSNPSQFARWFSPEPQTIASDNPEALALLHAIGADPNVILA